MPDDDRKNLQEMLIAAAEGDDAAWRNLVEAYSGRVYSLLRSQCGDGELAEELAQSTFCTVVTKLSAYTELGRFEAWLFRIAMNRLRDEMRRRRRHAIPVEADTLATLAGGTDPGRDAGVEPSEFRALREALDRLSDADRRIVHLRHIAGLTFKQIAEVLDEPLGTVLARQHRALRKLADLMNAPRPAPRQARTPPGAAE